MISLAKTFLLLFLLLLPFAAVCQKDTSKFSIPLDKFYSQYDFEGDCGYYAYTDGSGQVRYVFTDTSLSIPPDEMNNHIKKTIAGMKFQNSPNTCIHIKLCIRKNSKPTVTKI